jgi:glycyl-tRNA synthetase alpha subunit
MHGTRENSQFQVFQSTSPRSALIKLFLKILKFSKNYLFEMPKYKKLVENQQVLASSQSTIADQVFNNEEHFSILQFGGTLSLFVFASSRKCCAKRVRELAKEVTYIYCQKFHKLLFLLLH